MKLTTEQIKSIKNGNTLELTDEQENHFLIWFNSTWQTFCLEKNAKVIKSVKGIKTILNKLDSENATIIN
tara:strand:- start:1662 stop:1871 length:210 start_codon:yes stop_codon:yes gene_type:complete